MTETGTSSKRPAGSPPCHRASEVRAAAEQVAERAGLSRSTLHLMEKGSAGTSLGKLVQVLAVLGQEGDLSEVAADDVLGRKLEDARLTKTRRRAPKKKSRG